MNTTKKITNAAILLAIIGVLLMIDKLIGFFLSFYITLGCAIVLIMYMNKYSMKDGIYLSLGILVFIFMFGYIDTYIYGPGAILFAFIYCYFENKGFNFKKLSHVSIISYGLIELLSTVAILPLFGVTLDSELTSLVEMMNYISNSTGVSYSLSNNILYTIIILSTLLTGVLEGYLVNLLSVYLLRRFKIKTIVNNPNEFSKPNTILSYVCMILFIIGYILINVMAENSFTPIIIAVVVSCACILIYYGFIFIIILSKLKNMRFLPTLLMIMSLFMPVIFILIIVIGFLYGSGPLYNYIRSFYEQQK